MMTKRMYNQTIANLNSRKALLETQRDEMIAKSNAGQQVDGDGLNALHDEIDDIERDLRDTDRNWRTRKWDAADWTSYDLAAANID